MQELFQNPAVQAGAAPFAVALLVAAIFARSRVAWFAIVAGYATMIALSTGFHFSPLSASRKVLLLALAAPVLGFAIDLIAPKVGAMRAVLAIAAAAAALWASFSVLEQREATEAIWQGALVAASAAAIVWLTLGLRRDGLATGAAGLGLGLATGIAALLSASTGFFMAGIAIAAASGALLVVQLATGRSIAAGYVGTLGISIATALFACASLMIAKLPWYALPLFALVPAAAALAVGARLPVWLRAGLLSAAAVAAAAVPVAAAWHATRVGVG